MRLTSHQKKAIDKFADHGFRLSVELPEPLSAVGKGDIILIKRYGHGTAVAIIDKYGKAVRRHTVWKSNKEA